MTKKQTFLYTIVTTDVSRKVQMMTSLVWWLLISLFHHKHCSTNNKQYAVKQINTTHTYARTYTQTKKKINVSTWQSTI